MSDHPFQTLAFADGKETLATRISMAIFGREFVHQLHRTLARTRGLAGIETC